MKKLSILVLLIVLSSSMKSQWLWDYGLRLGASNYLGDIGGEEKTRRDFLADMKWAKTRWDGGIFARYKWQPRLSLKLAFDWVRLEGDDKLSSNPGRHYRNFNFKNDILDLAVTGEFFFYEDPDLGNTYRYKNSFRAYILGGIGGYFTNPKTIYKGEWVALQPYQTEGVKYGKFGINIPMGAGFYFTFNKKHRVGFEMNYRKTFTDYLDDISGNYPAAPSGDAYKDGLVLRTPELGAQAISDNPGAASSHTWGQKRGDKTHKDAYMTMSVSYSYVIRGKSSFYKSRRTGLFGGKKRKMRKIRAKF
jgi:hypothetical protein